MHMLNVISKRIKLSSRDAIMDESHIKGSMKLYVMNIQKLKVSQVNVTQSSNLPQSLSHLSRSIRPNHINLSGELICNKGCGNCR